MMLIANDPNAKEKLNKKRVCPKCKGELDTRVSRGLFVKTLLFWLPVKRYICYKCRRKKYVWN